jgi:hypothetical protein
MTIQFDNGQGYDPLANLLLALDDLFYYLGAEEGEAPEEWSCEVLNPITRSFTLGSIGPVPSEKLNVLFECFKDVIDQQDAEEDSDDYEDEEE